ncbi:phosphatase PAP2 family protein [Streptomyces mirabilis]|uniref:phosphatase PAP2 family protein n=1 Tax=Streptomyces mirabilis TaxID=68239 RepID=UPI00365D2816
MRRHALGAPLPPARLLRPHRRPQPPPGSRYLSIPHQRHRIPACPVHPRLAPGRARLGRRAVHGASRVWVGVHYPHDVIVGLAVGATVVLTGYAVLYKLAARLLQALTRTPLRPVLTATAPATVPAS